MGPSSLPRIVGRSSSQRQLLRLPAPRSAARTTPPTSLPAQRKPVTKDGRSDRAQTHTEGKRKEMLRQGAAVQIDGVRFAITGSLGSGSFGCVWAADSESCGPAAVKEIVCRTPGALMAAITESRHLHTLARQGVGRIPALLAKEVERTGQDRWRVRIAMTRLPGKPLSKLFGGPRPPQATDLAQLYSQFSKACELSREMLSQLAPVLEGISTVMFHRDANPQNILLGEDRYGKPRFNLVDFGLAVSAERWLSDLAAIGAGEATIRQDRQNCNAVGHGCYWPPSAWFVFAQGVQALCTNRDLRMEYQYRLDFHSLGLAALQLLIQKLPVVPDVKETGNPCCKQLQPMFESAGFLVLQLRTLQNAWQRYWEEVSPLWRRLLQACNSNDNLEALRVAFQQLGVYKMVRRNLRTLRDAIRSVAEACERAPRNLGLKSVPSVMRTLLLLISSGETPLPAPCWSQVQKVLAEGSGSSRTSESTLSPRTSENSASSLSTSESML